MHDKHHNSDEFDEEFISKSQVKREAKILHDLGLELAGMSKHQRSQIPMDDELADAMVLADKIRNKHEAYRRHLNYIAKILRDMEIEPIQQALDAMRNKHQQQTKKFHQYETLRDDLIAGGDKAVEPLLAEHPALERQKLRQLIRQANKEKAQEKPARGYRELFKYLKENVLF